MLEATITQLLDAQRYETARRMCREALTAGQGDRQTLLLLLHRALRALGDFAACREVLEGLAPTDDDDRLEVLLLRGEDYHLLSEYGFYRGSQYEKAGLTGEEYTDQMQACACGCAKPGDITGIRRNFRLNQCHLQGWLRPFEWQRA